MPEAIDRKVYYDELLRKLASGIRGAQLYAAGHPLTLRNMEALASTLRTLHALHPTVVVGIVGQEFVVADTPMPKASEQMQDLIRRLKALRVERITFERGVTIDALEQFVRLAPT